MDYDKLTKEQRTAIFAKGQVLVSAAAGSGKTMVLVERVINLLTREKDPIPADRLLIVTFTNAAAAEMFSRIEERLSAECEKHPENRALAKQRLLIESAKICTIDVFCLDLIRENFQAAGVSPSFKIMAPDAEKIAKTELSQKIIKRKLTENDEEFRQFTQIIGTDETVSSIAEYIIGLYDKSQSMPFPSAWLDEAVKRYDVPLKDSVWYKNIILSAEKMISSAAADVSDGLKLILSEGVVPEKCAEIFKNVQNSLQNVLDACENKGWNDIVHALNMCEFEPLPRNLKCDETVKNTLKTIKLGVDDTLAKVKSFFSDTYSECERLNKKAGKAVKTLVGLARELDGELTALLDEKSMVTFNRAEHTAFNLLCENKGGHPQKTPFAQNIIGLYDEILVDEFQDTNNLQDMLFTVLSDGGKKLFIVGDAKQSIYGFRNATPENFIQKKDSYPLCDGVSSPSKVLLNANFRSREGVCDYVNFLFEKIMSRETASIDYGGGEMLKPLAQYPENGETDTEIHIIDNGNTEDEARHIADYISSTVGKKILRDKSGSGALRPVKYGDIVILLRAASVKGGIYMSELKKRGIPVSSDSEDVFKTPEIMTAVSWLKSVDNPTDDISLLSAITGPAFGLSFDDAAKIKHKYKQRFFYGSVSAAAADGDAKCAEFLNLLGCFRKFAAVNTAADLLNEIYRKTMMPEIFSASRGGALKRDNLLFLLNLAEEYSSGDGADLSGFLRQLKNAENGGASFKSVGGDAVRIMSIHGSKGLQFPVCIIASCGSRFNDGDLKARLVFNDNADISFKVIDDVTGLRCNTVSRQQIINDKTEKMIAEEMRLLYVAATRAEEKLIFVISEDRTKKSVTSAAQALSKHSLGGVLPQSIVNSGRSYSYWIRLSLLLHPDGREYAESFETRPLPEECKGHIKLVKTDAEGEDYGEKADDDSREESEVNEKEVHISEARASEIREEILKRFSYEYPFSAALSQPSKLTVTELMQKENGIKYAFSSRPRIFSGEELTAAERGTATHRFLQYADFANRDIEAEISRLTDWEYLSEAEAESIDVRSVKAFYSSELFERIVSSDFYKREQRFLFEESMLDGEDYKNDKTVLQGSVDLLFAEDGELTVVDFKTTRFESDELFKKHYKIQLDIYSKAMEELFKMPVKERYIYSLFGNRAIKI